MSTVAPIRPTRDSRISDEEWQIRVDLAACYRLVSHYGWDDLIFTHISARVPGPEHHFLINPYGLHFSEITASSLLKVDLQGNKLLDSPYPFNAAGFTIHSAMHMARADAHCVIHLHTDDGVAVSAMEGGLLPFSQTSMQVCGDLAYHEYEGPALNHAERERLQSDLGDKHCMLLWNHGTLAIGSTVPEAFVRMYFFERACSMQVRAMAGGRLHMPSQAVIDSTVACARQMNQDSRAITDLAWPAMLRLLDRQDTGYRT
ncbi:MAG: class II aldolase/adducin family protein [Gammaproteobacteria bacterium]